MKWLPPLLAQLAQADAVLVRVHSSRGSVPREAGAWMAVFADMGASLLVVFNGLRLLKTAK